MEMRQTLETNDPNIIDVYIKRYSNIQIKSDGKTWGNK